MPKTIRVSIIFIVMVIFIFGCASPVVRENVNTPLARTEKIFSDVPHDESLLIRTALSHLNNGAELQDYLAARTALQSFVQRYPEDRWASCAQNLIQTIDTVLVLKNKMKTEKQIQERNTSERLKLLKENEGLKTEIAKYLEENEHLKGDLARLKQLEIQMEKRERMLK